MSFGLVGAALAIYQTLNLKIKKVVGLV